MLKNDTLDQWDRDYFFHPSTHLAQHARGEAPNRIVTGASGVHIEDRDGKRLLAQAVCGGLCDVTFAYAAHAGRECRKCLAALRKLGVLIESDSRN